MTAQTKTQRGARVSLGLTHHGETRPPSMSLDRVRYECVKPELVEDEFSDGFVPMPCGLCFACLNREALEREAELEAA